MPRSITRALPLILSFVLAHAALAQQPLERTLLWRITGNGLERPSYLYGTMHVSKRLAYHLTDSFFVALEHCDVVATELDPERWLEDMLASDLDALMRGPDRGSRSGDMYHRLFDLEEPDHRTMQRVCAERPDLVDHMMYRALEDNEDLEEGTFLDLFIYQCGRKLGKDIRGLEQFDDVLEIRIKAKVEEELHEDDQEEKDRQERARKTFEQIRKQGRSVRDLLEDAYRQNDLARMDTLYDLNNAVHYRHYFIDERNRKMVDAMEAILRERSLFAGVGAMHLPGPQGMINILRERGYRVEPVTSNITDRSMERKKQLDDLYHVPVPRVHSPADSLYTIELPGRAYIVPDRMGTSNGTLCLDQVNGTFFSIFRIPTHAALRGWDQERVMSRIDSTLLEAIPGRTERRALITQQGHPGYDIVSITKRGDRLRFRILVLDDEVLIVRAGAREAGTVDKEVDRMFATLDLKASPSDRGKWMPKAFPGASVSMPAGAGHHIAKPSVTWLREGAVIDAWSASGNDASGYGYMARCGTVQDLDHIEEDTFELGRFRDAFAERMGVKLLTYRHDRSGGAPTCRASFTRTDGDTLHVLWRIRGPHYYMLATDAPAGPADAFFSSLAFSPFPAPETTAYEVPLLACRVGADSWNARMGESYRSFRTAEVDARDPKEEPYRTEKQRELLLSPAGPEAVRLDLQVHHKFYSEKDMDAYWRRREKDATERIGSSFKRKAMGTNAGLPSMDMVFTDSTSSRAILLRAMNKAGATWTLSAGYDTTEGLSPWQRHVFDTFTTTDTTFRRPVTDNKVAQYLETRASTEKEQVEQAKASLSVIYFREGDGPALRNYIVGKAGLAEELKERAAMVRELGPVEDPDMLPFLKMVYLDAGDTAQLQLAVLRVLARQHTTEASKLFQELVFVETPFVKDASEITSVFSPFFDSLETARPLFPKVLDLTRFPEYRMPVYNLLAALVENRLVKPDTYASQKDILLVEANVELKRALSMTRSTSGTTSGTGEGSSIPFLERRSLNRLGSTSETDDAPANTLKDEVRAGSPLVMSFVRILLPFHGRDAKVRAWTDKVLACNNDRLVLETACLLARAGRPVDAALWKKYSEQVNTREWLRVRTIAIGQPELFTPAMDSARYLAEGLVFANRYIEPGDSIRFMGERTVRCRYGEGRVFFFAHRSAKADEDDEWRMGQAGLFGADDGVLDERLRFTEWSSSGRTLKTIGEVIDDEVDDIRAVGRPHVRGSSLY